ncbi:MAG: hypothetical protein H7Y89_07150 [Steroidobacteraceae bacterium]|nr:hypothetical protein [Steroidobacteraceae bacterium]
MSTTLSSAPAATSPPSKRTRFSVYIPLALLAAAIAIAGFWRSYFGALFSGRSQAEWLLHLHAAVFMGWIALVGFQAYLAMRGRIALHKKIGRFGMAYGALLVVVGLGFALILFTRRVAELGPENITRGPLLSPITDMFVFSVFLAGAWIMRARPELHRRFILLATTTLLIAAVGRTSGGTASVAARDVIPFLIVWLSPVWLAMLYDWVKHRTVHGVYVFGGLLLVALRYRQLIRETDTWIATIRAFAHWVAKHLL